MTLETLRTICLALPGATEDVKWEDNLCFCVGGKIFVIVNLDPPHSWAFKCTPDRFFELVEREGIIQAPHFARTKWAREVELGVALERAEIVELVKASYDLVVAGLPKGARPGAGSAGKGSRGPKPARRGR